MGDQSNNQTDKSKLESNNRKERKIMRWRKIMKQQVHESYGISVLELHLLQEECKRANPWVGTYSRCTTVPWIMRANWGAAAACDRAVNENCMYKCMHG
jgi:hypothetical protein